MLENGFRSILKGPKPRVITNRTISIILITEESQSNLVLLTGLCFEIVISKHPLQLATELYNSLPDYLLLFLSKRAPGTQIPQSSDRPFPTLPAEFDEEENNEPTLRRSQRIRAPPARYQYLTTTTENTTYYTDDSVQIIGHVMAH